MEIVLAIAAALFFALGTVLQQKVVAEVPDDEAMKANLLVQLAKRPVWVLGFAVIGLGFLCQAAALHFGKLVVVQPLLATAVVFALPFGRWIVNRRITRNDVIGATAVAGGLILFLVLADPQGGVKDASAAGWLISGGIAGVVCLGLVVASRGRRPSPKATLLGMAAGILYGFSAGLILTVTDDLDDSVVALLTDWHLYALIVVGWLGVTVSQAALQTGALAPAISTQMSLDPLVSILLGILVFQERIDDTFFEGAVALGGLVLMVFGLMILARSEAHSETAAEPGASGAGAD